MQKSEQINELAVALNKVQAKLEGAKKDGKNPFFKSDYATLHSAWEACRPLLSDNGLSIVQIPDDTDDSLSMETILMHSSGQWISGRLEFKIDKKDPQKAGSAITYARRYMLMSILGICPEDDDAESVIRKPVVKPAVKPAVNKDVARNIADYLEGVKYATKKEGIDPKIVVECVKVKFNKKVTELNKEELEALLDAINTGKVALG